MLDLLCLLPSWIFLNKNEEVYSFKILRFLYMTRVFKVIFRTFEKFKKWKLIKENSSETTASILVFTIFISFILHLMACTFLWLGFICYDHDALESSEISCEGTSWAYKIRLSNIMNWESYVYSLYFII